MEVRFLESMVESFVEITNNEETIVYKIWDQGCGDVKIRRGVGSLEDILFYTCDESSDDGAEGTLTYSDCLKCDHYSAGSCQYAFVLYDSTHPDYNEIYQNHVKVIESIIF